MELTPLPCACIEKQPNTAWSPMLSGEFVKDYSLNTRGGALCPPIVWDTHVHQNGLIQWPNFVWTRSKGVETFTMPTMP